MIAAFARAVPPWAYALAAALALAGVRGCELQRATQQLSAAKAAASTATAALAADQAAQATTGGIDASLTRTLDINRLRADRLRDRPRAAARPAPAASTAGANDAATSSCAVPLEAWPALVDLARDADDVAARLTACQAFVAEFSPWQKPPEEPLTSQEKTPLGPSERAPLRAVIAHPAHAVGGDF